MKKYTIIYNSYIGHNFYVANSIQIETDDLPVSITACYRDFGDVIMIFEGHPKKLEDF